NWKENKAPANGDTLVFDTTTSGFKAGAFGTVPNSYTPNNDLAGLTLNGIIMNSTTGIPWSITGNAVTINNTSQTDTPGISSKTTAGTNTVSFGGTGITLGSNITLANTSAAPTSTTPSLNITSPIVMSGKNITHGTGATAGDTGLTFLSGVLSGTGSKVIQNGSGLVALTGTNTFDGGVDIQK